MAILITGAAGGLGSAVCRVFHESGVKIIAVDQAWKETPTYATLDADLSTSHGADAMIARAQEHSAFAEKPSIDGVIHLVGGFSGGKPVAQTDDKTFDLMLNVNLRIAFNTIRATLRPMIKDREAARSSELRTAAPIPGGRIIAIGSRAAVEPSPNFAAYAISKAALVSLIKNVAAEVKPFGVTANVVLPSTIDTPANRAAMPNADFSKWVTPESIAKLLLWLASDAAADVNGAVIPIYGNA